MTISIWRTWFQSYLGHFSLFVSFDFLFNDQGPGEGNQLVRYIVKDIMFLKNNFHSFLIFVIYFVYT